MEVGISWLETLQLGIDGGELLTQKERFLLLGERLVDGGGSDFDNGELFRKNICEIYAMKVEMCTTRSEGVSVFPRRDLG
jgi:hypothetical protein